MFAGDPDQCLICRERNAGFLEKYVGLQTPRRSDFAFQLFTPTKSLSTSGKIGEDKCSVWKNPSSVASHSHKAQNTSLHGFKTRRKNQKLRLCCKKKAGGPKGVLKFIGPCNSRSLAR